MRLCRNHNRSLRVLVSCGKLVPGLRGLGFRVFFVAPFQCLPSASLTHTKAVDDQEVRALGFKALGFQGHQYLDYILRYVLYTYVTDCLIC